MNEILPTVKSDRVLFARIMDAFDKAGAALVSQDDRQQLLYPFDQMYIAYACKESFSRCILNIIRDFSLSDKLDDNTLSKIAHSINVDFSAH